ncbi:MAG: pilus assembly protein PilM [Deltaproteobacteria bacterium]|nr:pilus assembly protein PilM [Deltaproteobacteria bacterium]
MSSISKSLSVSEQQAESLFKQHAASKTDDAVQEQVAIFLSQLVVEIQRSIDAFCLMFHSERVDSSNLCGGGSLIKGICEFLTKNLGVETKKLNPFENIDVSSVGGQVANPELYALAMGLAIPEN